MITCPKDIERLFEKYSEEDTRDMSGVMVAIRWLTDYGAYSQLEQFCDEIYREFQATSELAKLKERVLELERKEFERTKSEH